MMRIRRRKVDSVTVKNIRNFDTRNRNICNNRRNGRVGRTYAKDNAKFLSFLARFTNTWRNNHSSSLLYSNYYVSIDFTRPGDPRDSE